MNGGGFGSSWKCFTISGTQDFSFGRTGLRLLQSVALCTQRVDVIQHTIQQSFGRCLGNAGSLQLPDLAALAVDLRAHTFDLSPNEFDSLHGAPVVEVSWRHKNKQGGSF
ncbi:hypothetical protein CQ12_40495 [Bradyrhizobium jicamae]|uniref:Uncharacterized protein n=1 Tax=Bradyrhizobium jicamae TaxID=280332 RepID=A0A0R3M1I2_9BRAD|nr:hypothetical protein [Bradyrhizobium jicamae]KRR13945.1 hypothetical protein CQ12_40495 [Bradyrhizobium jicamae]